MFSYCFNNNNLRSICLVPTSPFCKLVEQLRSDLNSNGFSGFQDPPRKAFHTTLVSEEEFSSILHMYRINAPSSSDEWARFKNTSWAAKDAVQALAKHRADFFSSRNFSLPDFVFSTSTKHIEIQYLFGDDPDNTATCHTTVAYWPEGLTPDQRRQVFEFTKSRFHQLFPSYVEN